MAVMATKDIQVCCRPADAPASAMTARAASKGDHSADASKCPLWRHRFDREWIDTFYAEVRARMRSTHIHTNTVR